MEELVYLNQRDNKRKGVLLSILFHLLLLLLLLIPCMQYFDPPKNLQGVTVMLGIEEASEVETKSSQEISKSTSAEPKEESKSKTPISNSKTDVQSKVSTEKAEVKSSPTHPIKEGPSKEELERMKAERKAREEAERKAKEKEDAKSKFGSLFNKNNEDENSTGQGDPLGKPDASALEGLTEAYGKTGQGLDDRGMVFQPVIKDDSQKTGRVVVRICVSSNGDVISARYTQKGSTTTDSHLIELAERNARKYKFSKSEIDEQCGNIIIDFKLK